MVGQTSARCHHSTDLRLPPKPAAMPPVLTLRPSDRAWYASEPLPDSARDGFDRIESPPPRASRVS